jgi:polyribonucleotide nucleotidyltransferase
MSVLRKTVALPDGKEIHIETGRLARQADGACVVRCGDTMLLATVVASSKSKTDIDYLPLSVDYQEKYASSGKIPGGFFKREGRLGENEILISRLVDRALRPLFPDDYHADVQVMIQLMSADRQNLPDALACFAASTAILCSDIPFPEAVSEVRVIRKDGQFIINPTAAEMVGAELDLIVAGTKDSILMVEGEMEEVSEELFLEAMIAGHKACIALNEVQEEFRRELGKKTREYEVLELNADLAPKVRAMVEPGLREVAYGDMPKGDRSDRTQALLDGAIEAIKTEMGEAFDDKVQFQIVLFFKDIQKEVVRGMMLNDGRRLDGRTMDKVRDIWSEVGYLPRAHGSALFTRGETQSICTTTLGTKLDEQTIDGATVEGTKRFLLHYNFPSFSTGEVKPNRGPGRREVGHGNLAERALKKVVPTDFPYTIRVVSDILESNGSSSMATVCGGCLCLMDAGVNIKAPVSGIAMGLVTDKATGKYAVLSDILGDEDHLGDMDFKVAGTLKGLTACQMDMKVRGLSYEVLGNALQQSKAGRLHILNKMMETLSEPRKELSVYAPRIEIIEIPQDMIGAVIGPGGKVVQEIQRSTGTTVVIEEKDSKGFVTIYSSNEEKMATARKMVKDIVAMPEVGEVYQATVKSIKEFGAFVEFMPGREGLLHISEIAYERLPSMDGVLEVGETFPIKLIGVDSKTGKFRLSRKVLLPKPEGYVEPAEGSNGGGRGEGRGPRREGGGGFNRGGGGGGGRGGYNDRGPRREGGGNRENRGPRPENRDNE